MLTENEVLERAFRALDELVGQTAAKRFPNRNCEVTARESIAVTADTPTIMTTKVKRGDTLQGHPQPDSDAPSLKGQAVELWCDHAGGRVVIVADEQDAQDAIRRFGAQRGGMWIPAEIELVASIPEQAIRDEVAAFKRSMDGCLSTDSAGPGVSPDEWRAQALNRLF